ncbi:MAG: hypothetical protein NPIRA05_00690 [Nitrospirales bacterium]|nr:MAG: hypothetical protein NPIRA05_00690 [Nitrospirales bacterium]
MVITGLLWANARFTYWEEGYKERVGRVAPAPPLSSAQISPEDLFKQLKDEPIASDRTIEEVILHQDFGRLLYEVRLSGQQAPSAILIDALTNERLSPLSSDLAGMIARQYIKTDSQITNITMEWYIPHNTTINLEAIRVNFGEPDPATIILDRHTGKILEDESPWRQVHFLVKQFHQLNFFGFNKTLLNIPGLAILIMSLSGLWLWRLQVVREQRARQKASYSEYQQPRITRQP